MVSVRLALSEKKRDQESAGHAKKGVRKILTSDTSALGKMLVASVTMEEACSYAFFVVRSAFQSVVVSSTSLDWFLGLDWIV